MKLKNLLFTFALLAGFYSMAQSYPEDRAKFIKVFQKKLSEYGNGDYQDFSKNELPTLLLESNEFPNSHFSQMIATCNLLESKKFKVYPDIYNYVFSVSKFITTKQPQDSYKAWHESVDKQLTSRQSKKFTDFIEMTKSFLAENKIAESANFSWYYLGGNYKFEFEKKAFIHFSEGDLICRVKSKQGGSKEKPLDSLVIVGATGVYTPGLKKWVGAGGKITWEKVGLDASTTFAVLGNIEISLKKSTLRADSVVFTTPYFDTPIEGMLSDRAFKVNREEDKIYPSFQSFDKKLLIKDVVPNVDYIGGFTMKGNRFVGAGTKMEPAQISIKHKGTEFIVAKSQVITITSNKIFIPKAETNLYFQNGDSLYHPGLDFNYDLEKKNIQLSRTSKGLGQAPFQDSYHQLDVFVPKIVWEVDSDILNYTYDFGTSRAQRIARLESKSFFNSRLYDELQGYSSMHPLVALSNFAYKYDEPTMTEGNAATALKMTVEQAKSTLIMLSNLGFINYDSETKLVVINPKLETYVQAKSGTMDFDNLQFVSDLRKKELVGYTEEQIEKDPYLKSLQEAYAIKNEERRLMKNFGSLDLTSMNLNLNAVDNVEISVAKNVVVFPNDSKVLIKENRNFSFSGWVNAGKIEMDATAANFLYEDYKIQILETKRSIFRVRPLRQEDGIKSIPMVSSIYGISGELIIDDITNRSGTNEYFENYPILKSTNKSKIYYNAKDIHRGAYDSSRFYYTLEPFDLDSLNGFKERAFRLDGELVSAGIFPKITEQVKIMPDYSFGFATMAPEGGYEFYGSEATYDNKIVLSHNGLQGSGTINFVYSTSLSRALTFLPDSTVGIALFENKAHDTNVEFPPIEKEEAYITYVPREKVLKAASLPKKYLHLFGGEEAKMRGTVIIKPEGMTGFGMIEFEQATLISDMYSFKRYDIDADTASFNLRNDDSDVTEDPLSFKTDNVNAHVSFKERYGEFNSNEGESVVDFPVNQYMCKMDQFKWFMDDFSIEMSRQEDKDLAITTGVDLKGPNFFSTHPKQDSLQFRAPKAKFDVKKKVLYCSETEYLDIADARIYPDSMKVIIRKKAKIDKFINAVIVADYITKYHKFEEAEVQILARRAYKGSGRYAYYDLDSTVSYIIMNDIKPDTAYQTRASGVINQESNFKLSPQFDYYGDVSIKASTPLILFNGATRINHTCDKFDRNWMSFTSELDPMNIQIPVSESMKDLDGGAISAGIVWRDSPIVDSLELYPTFLSSLVSPKDPIVMTSSGFLQYNFSAKEFQIASKAKLIDRGESGNFIALHTESCSMNGDGVISLGMNFGEVNVETVGVVNYNQSTGETSMNITARFDMKLDKNLMQDVAKRINEIPDLKPMDFNSTTLEQAILEWDGAKEANEFKSKYVIDGEVKKIPSSLSKSITFTGIRLSSFKDDNQNVGLITTLNSAVLVNMYGEHVMKYVPFKAFFQQLYSSSGGDKFSFYIDIPGGRDYFMHYSMEKKDGLLKIKTGDSEFSTDLEGLKEDKRKSKNFKYELTNNSVYINKFMELF